MSEGVLTPEAAHEMKWVQWVLPIVGVLSIAAGVIILAKPADSLVTLAVIAGIFVLVDGVLELAMSLSRRTANRGFAAVFGVLSVVVGVLLIRHPVGGVTFVAFLLAIWLMAIGVLRFIAAFDGEGHAFWRALLGLLEIAAGIVIIAVPHIGYATLAVIAGISFIANGAGLMVLGWAIHGLAKQDAAPTIQARPAT
jgi:uncharacterized membrane protein HdeD (DUF308 family)